MSNDEKSLTRSGLIVAAGTLISRVLGFARAILLAYAIGITGLAANAFASSIRIPNTIYTLIITGALSAVLVPQITRATIGKDGGEKYINKLVTLALTATALLLPIIYVLTPLVIEVLGTGWDDPAQTRLAILFAWFLIPQILFYSLYTVVGEVLNAKKLFGPFAWTPVVNNVISISGLAVFIVLYGADPDGVLSLERWNLGAIFLVAGCSTLGVATQGLLLFLFWKKVGLRFRLDFRFRGVGLGRIGKVSFWTLLTVLVAQITGFVYSTVLNFANAPGIPGIAAWDLVDLIAIMPHAVIVVSLVTVNFTRMSESVHQDNLDLMKEYLGGAVRTTLFLMVFVTPTLAVLAIPIFRIVQPTVDLANIFMLAPLAVFAFFAVLPFSITFVLKRGFFSLSDTRTPFLLTVFLSSSFFVGAILIAKLPPEKIAYSLAAMNFVGESLFAIVMFVALQRKIGSLQPRTVLKNALQTVAGAAPATAAGLLVVHLLGGYAEGSFVTASAGTALLTSALVFSAMLGVYFAVLILVKNPVALDLSRSMVRLLRRNSG